MSTVKNRLVQTEVESAIEQFLNYKSAQMLAKTTIDDMRQRLRKMFRELGVSRFDEITESMVIGWFVSEAKPLPETGKPRTNSTTRRLAYVYINQFCQWCVDFEKLPKNYCEKAPRPKNFKKDRRKIRRAMTVDELERLILVARFKPLADYARLRLVGGKNKDIYAANQVTFENLLGLAEQARSMKHASRTLVKLETQGIKWALIYRCLALIGLRWGELRTLKVGRFDFASNMVTLDSCFTKNGNADRLPVPAELCRDLQEWVETQKLTSDCTFFHMQQRGCQKFDRDIEVAGIPKVDAMGRSVDLHALRVSFVTMLAKYNVPTVLAQKLARHSSPLITQRIYMDADSLDSRAASNTLPALGSYREPVVEPVKEQSKAVAPASPTASGNDGLLKALLETADSETLRKALLKSLGQ